MWGRGSLGAVKMVAGRARDHKGARNDGLKTMARRAAFWRLVYLSSSEVPLQPAKSACSRSPRFRKPRHEVSKLLGNLVG